MANDSERETLSFSPLKPILLVMAAPLICGYFLRSLILFFSNYNILGLILAILIAGYTWKYLRITFLMLTLRPAVILTNESIIITATGYTIAWTDVMDVYLSSNVVYLVPGFKSYYITIRCGIRKNISRPFVTRLRDTTDGLPVIGGQPVLLR